MAMHGAQSPRVIAISVVYIALFSSAFIAIRVGVRYCPPLTLLAVRFLLAATLLFAFARIAGAWWWPKTRGALIRLILLGLLNTLLPALLNFIALRHATASAAAIVMATLPLALAIVAPRVLGERLSAKRLLGLILGFAAVVFVMVGRLRSGARADSPLGLTLMALSVCSMVGGTLLYKRLPPREPALVIATVQSLISGILLIPLILTFEKPGRAVLGAPLLWSLLWLVIVTSGIVAILWLWLLARGEASVVTSYLFFSPVFSLVYAAVLLHEPFTVRDGIGVIGVTAGVLLIRQPGGSRPGRLALSASPSVSKARSGESS